jgi:predicted transcriptional regulator
VKKTTVYLPESLKREVARLARLRSCSEAEVIRQAIQDAVARPRPKSGIIPGDDSWVEHIDEYMDGFGER